MQNICTSGLSKRPNKHSSASQWRKVDAKRARAIRLFQQSILAEWHAATYGGCCSHLKRDTSSVVLFVQHDLSRKPLTVARVNPERTVTMLLYLKTLSDALNKVAFGFCLQKLTSFSVEADIASNSISLGSSSSV